MSDLPRIALVATGGTIAGSASSATDATGYRAATTSVADMVASVPDLAALAQIAPHQFAQLDSSELTDALQLELARFVAALTDVDGVVITHGTDSLEETAYLLHLVLTTRIPVVLTGAIRPATALGADGPRNLFAAVVAATQAPAGVYAVMDDRIYSGRDVTKVAVDRFDSPYGPLGTVMNDRLALYRSVPRPGGLSLPSELPSSTIVTVHPGLVEIPAADVIVVASYGNGTIPTRLVAALEAARASGSVVVRASRTGAGSLTAVGASGDASVNDWIVVDDQSPLRARILAAVGATITRDERAIQELFYRY
jgi:glutamin-(asparagin-)ase